MTDYPEHEKLKAISDQSQCQGALLDWLFTEKGFMLADYYGQHDDLRPVHTSIPDILAEYHDIDQDKIETEKRQMLNELRASNA